jgi:hypothetical protein
MCGEISITLQKAGTTSVNRIPLMSNLFKKAQAIKSKKLPVASEMVAPTPALAASTPLSAIPAPAFPQFTSYLNPFIFNLMMMGMLGIDAGMPGVSVGMPAASRSLHKEHFSLPIDIPGDIHAFCEAYGIKEEKEQALESLGFVMGDNLGQVTEHEYKEARFCKGTSVQPLTLPPLLSPILPLYQYQ